MLPMRMPINRDLIGGVLLMALGAFVAYYASTHYELGTLRRMGPGMFPTLLGYLLCVVGLLIAAPSLYRARSDAQGEPVEWRSLITVGGALAAFALTVNKLGIIPAILLMTAISAYADGRLRPLGILLLGGVLAGLAVLVFHVLLGTPFPLLRWSW